MAIIKDLDSPYGIKSNYHRVSCIFLNANTKEITISVSSYITKQARDNNCHPIDSVDLKVPSEDYNFFITGNIYEKAYKWLKDNVVGFEVVQDDY